MTHDVFLNFRGDEIRKTIVSHLVSSLKTKYISTFIASEPFEDLDHEAMEQSLVAIPVISKHYVISDFWMDDLRKLIECEKIGTLTTIPIFFQVNPLDILSHAVGKYADTQSETLEMVRKWLYAQVSRKPSFNSNDWEDDSELVDNITSFASNILTSSTSSYHSTGLSPARSLKLESAYSPLNYRIPDKFKFQTWHFSPTLLRGHFKLFSLPLLSPQTHLGMKRRLKELRSVTLHTDSTVIGICGTEGVGKTTLAKHLYEEMSPRFQHHIYMKNNINKLQSILDMLNSEVFTGSSDNAIKEMMGNRKVLLVVDGVNDMKQLKGITKDASWFGPGSRVIVITQERSLLTECGVKQIYEVECPRYEEALAFFSEIAFKQSNPLPGFEGLSFRAVHVANRLPLALKLLGSFLRDREKDVWISTLRTLDASRDNYASEINRYIGADDYAPRRPIKVDRHIGVDEANSFPLYCLALE
ncbi:PREDICTED: disease resistance protein RLM3-like [Camelina sativa]|uniref:Disease resistance protein RLM3-like n=1 Tax=Camelina sativa TaxID=90675 RepID=A0ABM0STV7_CAMSA|nr:PREDICTED: disease resistance protein RLM3-like [Camelina sativa]